MPLAAGKTDGGIIAHDLCADLCQGLALGRVHFARHDRGSRLVFGQHQFAQTTAWSRAQKPDVIGDLEQAGGNGFQRPRDFNHRVMGGEGFELVGGGDKGQVGDARHIGRNLFAPAFGRVQPGAHSSAALGQFIDRAQGSFDAGNPHGNLMGVA